MVEYNKIYNESCLETMYKMDNDSIDLVMTSPPYANARKHTYGGIEPDKYIEWFTPIAKEIYRILKPTGSFILNIGDNTIDGETHLYTFEIPIVLKRQIGFKFIDPLIWHKKTTPPGKFKNRFKDGWEFCYHFSKTLDITFNPYAVAEPMKDCSISRALRHKDTNVFNSNTGSGFNSANENLYNKLTDRRNRQTGSGFGTNDYKIYNKERSRTSKTSGKFNIDDICVYSNDLALPMNVLYYSPETVNKGHSAVYPIEIPNFFIKAFSNENDIVYDPFMGSGTTAESCIRLNRKYIGSEILSENISVINNRLATMKDVKEKIIVNDNTDWLFE